jgi:hypothetical protein
MKRALRPRTSGAGVAVGPRTVGRRAGPVKKSAARVRLGPSAGDLVIVSRALADLAQYLEPRQESSGRGRVILDRRVEERRRAARTVEEDRRQSDRRRPPVNPTEALMRVLGFTVIPTAAASRDGSSSRRRAKRAVLASRAPGRSRQAARSHRARPARS